MKIIKATTLSILSLTLTVTQLYAQGTASSPLQDWFLSALRNKAVEPLENGKLDLANISAERDSAFKAYSLASSKLFGADLFSKPQLVKKGIPVKPSTYKITDKDSMKYVVLQRGSAKPSGGWPLYIAMHGGGGTQQKLKTPHSWRVNSREWSAQMNLSASVYPDNGIYFVPRMVNDNHGRWWKSYNTKAFDAMIKHAILHWGVNPNRVYMLGISEGGYGTEVLASLIPDKLAAANGMACGSGSSIHVENLRNLPFRTDVGERDTAFGRIKNARAKHQLLEKLKAEDKKGYIHDFNEQKGRGHGISYKEGPAWLTKHIRKPHPNKVVSTLFKTDDARNTGAYWVQTLNDLGSKKIYLTGQINKEKNTITISAKATKEDAKYQAPDWQQALNDPGEIVVAKGLKLRLWLHESQLDLSKPITLTINGEKSLRSVTLSKQALAESIAKFGDPNYAYPAYIDVEVK